MRSGSKSSPALGVPCVRSRVGVRLYPAGLAPGCPTGLFVCPGASSLCCAAVAHALSPGGSSPGVDGLDLSSA